MRNVGMNLDNSVILYRNRTIVQSQIGSALHSTKNSAKLFITLRLSMYPVKNALQYMTRSSTSNLSKNATLSKYLSFLLYRSKKVLHSTEKVRERNPVNIPVCNGIHCAEVPSMQCNDVPKEKCWDEPREKWWDEPRQSSKQVPKEKCWDEPHLVCQNIPKMLCQDIPKEKCWDDKNVVMYQKKSAVRFPLSILTISLFMNVTLSVFPYAALYPMNPAVMFQNRFQNCSAQTEMLQQSKRGLPSGSKWGL